MIKTTATENDVLLRSSAYNSKNGRYVVGGTVEVSQTGLGWWEKRTVLPDPTDIVYELEEKYVGRPDLLAYAFYSDTGLWWVIPQYNSILNPAAELLAGVSLIVPSLEKINSLYRSGVKVGGVLKAP